MIPMNIRTNSKEGYGFDNEEFSFDIPAVQRNEEKICFQNGHNKEFACIDLSSDVCDQGDTSLENKTIDMNLSERKTLRRLAFSQSLDKHRGIPQSEDKMSAFLRNRQLSESSSNPFSNVLLTFDITYDTSSTIAEDAVYEVSSDKSYSMIYRIDGSKKRYLKADTPSNRNWSWGIGQGDKSKAKDVNSFNFLSGPAGGVSVKFVDENDISDKSLPEYHWRFQNANANYRGNPTYHLINRLSGRGIKKIPDTVRDGTYKAISGSYGYLSMDSRSSNWQRFYFTEASGGDG